MNFGVRQICILLLIVVICCIGYNLFDRIEQYLFFYTTFFGVIIMYLHHMYKVNISQRLARLNDERLSVALLHVKRIMFNNFLEADITNNVLIGDNSRQLSRLRGIADNISYADTIETIVDQLIVPEFKTECWHMLSRDNIQREYDAGNQSFEYECMELSEKGDCCWIKIHVYIYLSQVTKTIRIISYIKNINSEKRQMIDLLERSQLDSMTGTYNRTSIPYVVSNVLRNKQYLFHALILIDIDEFKTINDTCGHITGDKVINETAKILKSLVRPTDFVARMGGDEFLVFLTGISQPEDAFKKASAIQTSVLQQNVPQLENVKWTFSMGIRIIDKSEEFYDFDEFDELYHEADQALYRAKAKGKNQYCCY